MQNSLLEQARLLVLHPSLDLVELYTDTLRAITYDGSVSVIEP